MSLLSCLLSPFGASRKTARNPDSAHRKSYFFDRESCYQDDKWAPYHDQEKSSVDDNKWWKNGTAYQIYPASYKDSNGDGIGDIPGIISSLDYIKDLGIDIIWLCPMYASPQVDMGYDISNYEDVYAPYGTLADMDALIAGCHQRGMRLIVDLVINHTSDMHQWFLESKSSKHNPKRDWYIWRPAKYDKDGNRHPPNNWASNFLDSAWTWDESTQEYYLHLFASEQPDLNWENPVTREAIRKSAMEFWLQKGVDGFRVDTANMYSKPDGLPDAPVVDPDSEFQTASMLFCNGPRQHEYLRELNDKVLSKYDCMTVGELACTPDPKEVLKYISAKEKQFNMVFQFGVVDLGRDSTKTSYPTQVAFTLAQFKSAIMQPQQMIAGTDAWTTVFLENHDQARSISRFASDDPKYRVVSGKMLAILLASLTGTLFIYQGQEIGMINFPKEWPIDEYKDVASQMYYNLVKERTRGDPQALAAAMAFLQNKARDNARSPMQWDDSPSAGFSSGTPWMRTNDSYREINAKRAARDPDSVLHFWKKMIAVRKQHASLLIHGTSQVYDVDNRFVFTFTKKSDSQVALVVLNFSSEAQPFLRPQDVPATLKLLASNVEVAETATLQPWEGRLYIVE